MKPDFGSNNRELTCNVQNGETASESAVIVDKYSNCMPTVPLVRVRAVMYSNVKTGLHPVLIHGGLILGYFQTETILVPRTCACRRRTASGSIL
jgi:hypothetical protein